MKISSLSKHGTIGGDSYGPIELALEPPYGAVEFNSHDLEHGNPDKLLYGGLGDGEGNWRLELTSHNPISVASYLRASDGFQTSMHAVVPEADEACLRSPFFRTSRDMESAPKELASVVQSQSTRRQHHN